MSTAVLITVSIGLAFGLSLVALRLDQIPETNASVGMTGLPAGIQLAEAFTAAQNAHDVDGLVDLFTEEDAGATVIADRFAWQKFEIRLWAQQQVQAGIRTEAYDFRVTEHGATWTADVYRDDWRALGLSPLHVLNSIWIQNGRLANFTSTPNEPDDLPRLGRLWQPGAVPERPSTTWRPKQRSAQRLVGRRST